MKKLTTSISCISLIILCLLSAFYSYKQLNTIPYGFHIDEMAGSVDIGCMVTEGKDAHHMAHPIFSNLNYGTPKPPTFIYSGILWAKFFGYSAPSLRALSVTMHLIGIVGLFFLAQLFFGWRYALISVTVASLSPWTWGLARIAFESLYASTFLIWGLYFFFRSSKSFSFFVAGLFFAAAMYSYPPFRLQTPLMLLTLILYTVLRDPKPLKSWVILFLTLIILSIPLVQKTLNGEVQTRFNQISIFSKDYLNTIHSSGKPAEMVQIFLNNYFLHLKPNFLWISGDPSYVHSTRHFGILGWLDILAIFISLIFAFMLIKKSWRNDNPLLKHGPWLLLLITNFFIGIIPAALTNSEIPNSLRITGSWPFFCLFSGFFIWNACERFLLVWIVTLFLSVYFALVFYQVYFKYFPQEGKGMFCYWTLEQANQAKTDLDWVKFVYTYRYDDYNARYFLMQYKGSSCSESDRIWDNMRDYLKAKGQY